MSDTDGRIDNLNRTLYSRKSPDMRSRRRLRFFGARDNVQNSWTDEAATQDTVEGDDFGKQIDYEKRSVSWMTKILIGSIIFFLICVGVGAYLFFNGANFISGDNININISGPISVPGGTPVSFDLDIVNNNNTDLTGVDLSAEFPDGTTNANDQTKELKIYREFLGDIPSMGHMKKTVSATVFGEENSQKQIIFALSYKLKGSNSLFSKQKAYDIIINSSPVSVTVSSLNETVSGQMFTLKVNVKSNSEEILKNVLVSVAYPFGFTFVSSDIPALPDKNTWRLGDIPPGGQKSISVNGRFQGENEDTRVFRVSVGSESSRNANLIGTEYISASQEVKISKPFMAMEAYVDGDTSARDGVGNFDQPVRVELNWTNNLPMTVSDAVITAKLSGTAYDKSFVQAGYGYFRSATNEIIWDQKTTPNLASVNAGDVGTVSFSLTPRKSSNTTIVNPYISFSVDVAGKRAQESGVLENLNSTITKKIKINTNATLSARVLRSVGPFSNAGTVPPKAERQTTYTIALRVDNTVNAVSSVQVSTKLPPYVKWLDNISPNLEDISYDAQTGQVTWNAGAVGANTVNSGRSKEVYFQISLEPSINQVGGIPTLTGDFTMTAMDDFTGTKLTAIQGYLSTRFSTDPSFKDGQEIVTN